MKKRYVLIGITCILLLIAGICYSGYYKRDRSNAELITNLSGNGLRTSEDEIVHSTTEGTASKYVTEKALDYTKVSEDTKASFHEDMENEGKPRIIYVHLCGEVIKPAVYEVAEGSRVIDLIELAGGLSKEAAGDYINQAQQVSDGQRIYIPSKEEIKELPGLTDILSGEAIQGKQSSSEMRININLADAKELMELPGVGEAKAASIVEYRTTNGSFQTIEELMKIPGIKEGLFNKVSPYITVR